MAARKLVVEVVEARNLLPKDGTGTSSPYARADFDGQRRKTRTVARDLNPAWNEALEFSFPPAGAGVDPVFAGEPLEVAVLHDVRLGPSRRSNFLGRVRLDARQFVRKGEEALIYFPLEKKHFFSWVRGDIGLKVYYVDEPPAAVGDDAPAAEAAAEPAPAEAPAADEPPKTEEPADAAPAPKTETAEAAAGGDGSAMEKPPEDDSAAANQAPEDGPPVMTTEAVAASEEKAPEEEPAASPPPAPMPRQVSMPVRRPAPPPPPEEPMERSKHDLVDKMPYLFVRVVRARGLPAGAHPHVRVSAGGRSAATGEARRGAFFEWDQTFAFVRDAAALESSSPGPTLEVSVWDLPPDADVSVADDRSFLGGLCFDVADVHARDPPDGPLATQWYRLEGGRRLAGADLMVATWAGTQADEAFADAWKADSPAAAASSSSSSSSRAKVYVSPKLWLLRLTVIEAQDTLTAPPPRDAGVAVRATLGFQSLKTRATLVARNGGPAWNEDLLFVAAEPFTDDDCLVVSLEVRHGKEAFPVGSASVSLAAVERRVDDRKVASKWLDLLPSDEAARRVVGKKVHMHGGRLHVRVCLDGGYNVADEPPYAASDFRPSARQLWRPPVGVVELGIVGCKGLLPMRAADGKGCTDAYAVAKYGPKWARTRTIADSFDPAWNEQYTWPVYDPCTVLTVGVFDDPPPLSPDGTTTKDAACSRPMGKVRIRLSTLERGRVYRGLYPLIMMLPTGAKRMGDVELAVRFATSASTLDVLHMYTVPALPAMHHQRPVPAASREALRLAAARITAAHLARSAEPPLRREVAAWMLDATSGDPRGGGFSMRKLRANWNRAAAALAWVADAARWVEDTRSWRNPTSTAMAHAVLVLLAWHPDLVVPTATLHAAAVGAWRFRRRPRSPAPHPCVRASMAEAPDREELDEEFDPVPSARPHEVVRARYDRARAVGARLQAMVGDVATQAERLHALVSWRDPRATGMFVALCVLVAVVLYMVPMRMAAVVAGFYYLRHPMFRERRPAPVINFFRRLPSMSERIM